ncbi:MAG: response regulator transcription factor [Nitrospira sp.]
MRRILVADDHPIVRQGLCKILQDAFAPVTIGEAETGQSVLEQVRGRAWDIVVLDVNLPDKNGLEVLKEIKVARPGQAVLMISFLGMEQYAVRALKAGASGYLAKDTAIDEIVAALKKIFQGGRYVSAALAEHLADGLGSKQVEYAHERLSDREYEVLRLLASGKTVSDIAESLCLSVKTISTYRSRLLEKLQLTTTAELIRYALDHKLV